MLFVGIKPLTGLSETRSLGGGKTTVQESTGNDRGCKKLSMEKIDNRSLTSLFSNAFIG